MTTTKHYPALGIFGVALLVLTACGGGDDDEGQGEASAENGEEEVAEAEEGEEEAEEDEAPELEEIENDMLEASTTQESVSITGSMDPELLMGDLGTGEDIDEDAAEEGEEDDDLFDIDITGTEREFTYRMAPHMDYVVSEDAVYQTSDSLVEEYALEEPPEGTDMPSPEDVAEAMEAESDWVDIGPEGLQFVETPAEFIEVYLTTYAAGAGFENLAEFGFEASTESVDGEDVWVYELARGDYGAELVVTADEEEPLLQEFNTDLPGFVALLEFNDWNEAEEPEAPDEALSWMEFEEVLQGL